MAVVKLLQPLLADLETRGDEQRVMGLFIVFRRCRADITDQMADRWSGRIIAGIALRRGDTRQVHQAHADSRIFGIVETVGDLNRLKAGGIVQRFPDAIDIVG